MSSFLKLYALDKTMPLKQFIGIRILFYIKFIKNKKFFNKQKIKIFKNYFKIKIK